jgi:hypothetical protein
MWSIGIQITTDNEGIRTAVKNLIPAEDDPKVNTYDYRYDPDDAAEDGTKQIRCEIRFDVKADRDDVLNSLKGLAGVINACETPSYVRPHLCNGDDAPCTIEEGGVYK